MNVNIRNWIRNWVFVMAIILLAFAAGLGWDTTTNLPDMWEGFGMVWSVFGGITSFGALLGIALVVAFLIWGTYYMTQTDFTNRKRRQRTVIFIACVAFLFGMWLGMEWVQMPSGSGWVALAFFALSLLIARAFRGVRKNGTALGEGNTTPKARSWLRRPTRTAATPVVTNTDDAPAPIPAA